MEFYDSAADVSPGFIADQLGLSLPDAEVGENVLLWNDYTWNVNTPQKDSLKSSKQQLTCS